MKVSAVHMDCKISYKLQHPFSPHCRTLRICWQRVRVETVTHGTYCTFEPRKMQYRGATNTFHFMYTNIIAKTKCLTLSLSSRKFRFLFSVKFTIRVSLCHLSCLPDLFFWALPTHAVPRTLKILEHPLTIVALGRTS